MEGAIVHGNTDARFRLDFVNYFVGQRVPLKQVGHHMESGTDIFLAGRVSAIAVCRVSIDIGFVDRYPRCNVFLQSLHRLSDKDCKFLRRIIVFPSILTRPARADR